MIKKIRPFVLFALATLVATSAYAGAGFSARLDSLASFQSQVDMAAVQPVSGDPVIRLWFNDEFINCGVWLTFPEAVDVARMFENAVACFPHDDVFVPTDAVPILIFNSSQTSALGATIGNDGATCGLSLSNAETFAVASLLLAAAADLQEEPAPRSATCQSP